MDFETKKKLMLSKLNEALKLKAVDEDVIPFLNLINRHAEYFTTSTCSGRIVIIEVEKLGKKEGSIFLYKSHKYPDFNKLLKLILNYNFSNDAWLLVEPPLFHLGVKNLDYAKKMLNIGLSAGLRRSGIRSIAEDWIVVALWGSGHINLPLGNANKNFLAENELYISYLLTKVGEVFNYGRNQLDKLYDSLKENLN
ncbi:MAG: hypothetical protein HeimC3_27020 [Candidatus Heimdallarchaeota archaeon LC_3]|nr:MAG: hypothetical protein HeimC3_27020 [Candidatus Heimdallarchaeota archaeon LC_3]